MYGFFNAIADSPLLQGKNDHIIWSALRNEFKKIPFAEIQVFNVSIMNSHFASDN